MNRHSPSRPVMSPRRLSWSGLALGLLVIAIMGVGVFFWMDVSLSHWETVWNPGAVSR